nr:hypothetical protein Iba_chr03cCG8320 [Ipomoea batatas]
MELHRKNPRGEGIQGMKSLCSSTDLSTLAFFEASPLSPFSGSPPSSLGRFAPPFSVPESSAALDSISMSSDKGLATSCADSAMAVKTEIEYADWLPPHLDFVNDPHFAYADLSTNSFANGKCARGISNSRISLSDKRTTSPLGNAFGIPNRISQMI